MKGIQVTYSEGRVLAQRMGELLLPRGFHKRGRAFYRIHGDGIVQLLKFQPVPGSNTQELRFGIFSMYSKLNPSCFSSRAQAATYVVLWFVGLRSAQLDKMIGFTHYQYSSVPAEYQLQVLHERVLPWLNAMQTQKDLVAGMCTMERKRKGGVQWDDALKIVPFLHSDQTEEARKVIQTILQQHAAANETATGVEAQAQYAQMQAQDAQLRTLLRMVEEGDRLSLEKHWMANYTQNCEYARFCMEK